MLASGWAFKAKERTKSFIMAAEALRNYFRIVHLDQSPFDVK
jgi:hypothetical protein